MTASILPNTAVLFQDRTETPLSFSETLPDHLPDMRKIIAAESRPMHTEAVLRDGRVCLTANGSLVLVYIGESKGHLKTAVFPITLEKEYPLPDNVPTDCVKVAADCDVYAANASMSSSRTVECRAIAVFSVTVTRESLHDFDDFSHDGVCLHETSFDTTMHESYTGQFEFHQDITLDTDNDAIAELILPRFSVRVTACRRTGTGFSIDGNLVFQTVCRAEKSENAEDTSYFRLTKTFILAEEIGTDESAAHPDNGASLLPCAKILSESASVTFDSYGENRVIRLNVEYAVCIDVFTDRTVRCFDDAFCPNTDCHVDTAAVAYEKQVCSFDETLHITERLNADTSGLAVITDCRLTLMQPSVTSADGNAQLTARAELQVYGKNENGDDTGLGTLLRIHAPMKELPLPMPSDKVVQCVSVLSADAALRAGEIVADITLKVVGVLLHVLRVTAVCGVEVPTETQNAADNAAYIFCYPNDTDTVWQIAKRYGVPPETVMSANDLTNDSFTPGAPLLIPQNV